MKLSGNGRKPYTINFKKDIMDEFKKYCDKEGFLPARRLEVLMKGDMNGN